MLHPNEILNLVRRDVETGLGHAFEATDGFQMIDLADQGFDYTVKDIPHEDVSFVMWSYRCRHTRPLTATQGRDVNDAEIPVIDVAGPDAIEDTPAAALHTTGREITITGNTVVVTRPPGSDDVPRLLRFVDWADVFTQLGYVMTPRYGQPDSGRRRISDLPNDDDE
jgi:hypothetical protein